MTLTGVGPSEEAVRAKYAHLFNAEMDHNHGQVDYIKPLMDTTGIRPLETEVQRWYTALISRHSLGKLEKLHQITGIAIKTPEDTVQHAYAEFVAGEPFFGVSLDSMRTLQRLTGIEPKLPEDAVQRGYSSCIRLAGNDTSYETRGSYDQIRTFNNLRTLSGFVPSQDAIDHGYRTYFRGEESNHDWRGERRVRNLHILWNNGIRPSQDVIQEWYITLLNQDNGSLIPALRSLTGAAPEEKPVQEKYAAIAKTGFVGGIKYWQKTTGITPKLSEDAVQEGYAHCLMKGFLDHIQEMKQFTGIGSKFTEQLTQEAYISYLHRGKIEAIDIENAPNSKAIKQLREMTGTNPPEDLVQRKYAVLAKQRWWNHFKDLQEATGITPSPEAYRSLFQPAQK